MVENVSFLVYKKGECTCDEITSDQKMKNKLACTQTTFKMRGMRISFQSLNDMYTFPQKVLQSCDWTIFLWERIAIGL